MDRQQDEIRLACAAQCTGCGACADACPVSAIDMTPDEMSFVQPVIRTADCIWCHHCESVCPVVSFPAARSKEAECHAVWADDAVRAASSSGGVFTLLAEQVIAEGGAVWGAAMTDALHVRHVCAQTKEELAALRGAKYVQSDTKDAYRSAAQQVESGRKVLFSGTPCQVAGLRNFLGDEPENLLLVDLVCHGVPSQKMWSDYLTETCPEGTPAAVSFRDKSLGWVPNQIVLHRADGGKKVVEYADCPYEAGFHQNLLQRTSCYDCPFSEFPRQGDITLGDFWGIERMDASWNDNRGTSLVLVNTEKGRAAFDAVAGRFAREQAADAAYSDFNRLHAKIAPHPQRQRFFELWKNGSFTRAADFAANRRYDVAVLGCWSVENHGSNMTYYALYRTLRDMGYETLMVERPASSLWKPHERPEGFLHNPYRACDLAPLYADKRAMKDLNDRCDRFVLGSDQLLYHDLYRSFDEFIDMRYIHADKTKLAFATSLGRDRFEGTPQQRATLSLFLKQFDAVSVRERDGVDVVRREFGVDAVWMPDPVFLCPRSVYEELALSAPFEARGPFVGVYVLDPTPEKEAALRYASETLGMPLRVFSDVAHSEDDMKQAWTLPTDITADNETWLRSIMECSFFITDSFHGTCFAILFNKPFISIGNAYRGITRFTSLLESVGLSSRLVEDITALPRHPELFEPVDFGPVNRRVEERAEAARAWLREHLEHPARKSLSFYDVLDDRIDAVQDNAAAALDRSLHNETWLANTHGRVDALEARAAEDSRRISETQTWLANTHERVNEQERQRAEEIARLTEELETTRREREEAAAQFHAELENVRREQGEAGARLNEALENARREQEETTARLNAELESAHREHEEATARLEAEIRRLNSTLYWKLRGWLGRLLRGKRR